MGTGKFFSNSREVFEATRLVLGFKFCFVLLRTIQLSSVSRKSNKIKASGSSLTGLRGVQFPAAINASSFVFLCWGRIEMIIFVKYFV